jgi:hypothetical protein
MADEAARIRAVLDGYGKGALGSIYAATLVTALRAVVDRCDELSNSNYPAFAGIAQSLLRDVERELGVQAEYAVPVFAPQQLPSEEA